MAKGILVDKKNWIVDEPNLKIRETEWVLGPLRPYTNPALLRTAPKYQKNIFR
jgi:hypothetical protein